MTPDRDAAPGDEGGVLGNLPRSRPGRRSEKRRTAPGKPGAGGRKTSARRARAPERAEREPDPVGEVLRAAGQAAEAGLRVASGVTREVLRRLPRP